MRPIYIAGSLFLALTLIGAKQVPIMIGQGPILGSQNQNSGTSGASQVLIKANSGTDTTTTATTVDTALLPPLTIKDYVYVTYQLQTTTQNTNQVTILDVTDSQGLTSVTPAPFATTNPTYMGSSLIQASTAGLTNYTTLTQGMVGPTTPARSDFFQSQGGYAAGWTPGWTIGLRHGGVVSGGTFRWQWAVYVIKGE